MSDHEFNGNVIDISDDIKFANLRAEYPDLFTQNQNSAKPHPHTTSSSSGSGFFTAKRIAIAFAVLVGLSFLVKIIFGVWYMISYLF